MLLGLSQLSQKEVNERETKKIRSQLNSFLL